MTVAAYWPLAMDPQTYVSQMTMNRELFERRIVETVILPSERATFATAPLRVLAITEDFCGDSAQFIPPLIRLAQELDSFDVAVLLRLQHRELADGYRRPDGYQAIPVLIVLDEYGRELGSLIERPARSSAAMAAETRRFARDNPQLEGVTRTYDRMPEATRHAVRENIEQFRERSQAEMTRWLFEDLAALLLPRTAPVSR